MLHKRDKQDNSQPCVGSGAVSCIGRCCSGLRIMTTHDVDERDLLGLLHRGKWWDPNCQVRKHWQDRAVNLPKLLPMILAS